MFVCGKTAAVHDYPLNAVLQKLKDAGFVTTNYFIRSSLKFLGHVVRAC